MDVAIRHPMSSAYQPLAGGVAGHAAAVAARQKLRRYPASAGRAVTPFAVETWGRLDSGSEELLEELAAAATRREAMRGNAPAPGGCLKRWRAALDAVLQRGVASALLSSQFGLAGTALRSWRQARVAPVPRNSAVAAS